MSLVYTLCAVLSGIISTILLIKLFTTFNYTEHEESDIKTILYWNTLFDSKDFYFGLGREAFVNHGCKYTKCYATSDLNYTYLDKFDAIIFHGPTYYPPLHIPPYRSFKQIYVYFNQESPSRFGAGWEHNDMMFNMTITHRLESDIPAPYFAFYDTNGRYVAPMLTPIWTQPIHDAEYLKRYHKLFERKSKPIAWFVSNCDSAPSHRGEYVEELKKYLPVDIFGDCGEFDCPKDNQTVCEEILKNDYFFYLSFENSLCIDYVTEKLTTAFKGETIPITLNGADMNRISPPYSYIDAKGLTPLQLSEKIKILMNDSVEYLKYFWWKDTYNVKSGYHIHPFCDLCEILHNKSFIPKSYHRLTHWVNGDSNNHVCFKGYPFNNISV